jgi:hypothetical protein
MLSVDMLNVIMLRVAAPPKLGPLPALYKLTRDPKFISALFKNFSLKWKSNFFRFSLITEGATEKVS